MAEHSKIEWTEATWNPVTGCTKVSPGCAHCYAERIHDARHAAYRAGKKVPAQYATPFEKVVLHPDRLELPRHWRKPRLIFVNSMSDLFHEDVPDKFIAKVFQTMHFSPQHTFQVLTKRPRRMAKWLKRCGNGGGLGWMTHNGTEPAKAYRGTGIIVGLAKNWPLPNVWLGVSVENQRMADQRIPLLLQAEAARSFVSVEPLLDIVNLEKWLPIYPLRMPEEDMPPHLSWAIVGGESGPEARPMHPGWARALRDQCVEAGVPFFFKQWGGWIPIQYISQDKKPLLKISLAKDDLQERIVGEGEQAVNMVRVGKKKAGRLLDGREWNQMPAPTNSPSEARSR